MRFPRLTLCAIALLQCLGACSPALDWRQAPPGDTGVTMLFPCRPRSLVREVPLDQVALPMHLWSCVAAKATFSIAFVDVPSAERVRPTLASWRAQAAANLGAVPAARQEVIPGATPDEGSGSFAIAARLPDGRHLAGRSAFFVHGLRLYQATVLGEALGAEALETFFGSIRVAAPAS